MNEEELKEFIRKTVGQWWVENQPKQPQKQSSASTEGIDLAQWLKHAHDCPTCKKQLDANIPSLIDTFRKERETAPYECDHCGIGLLPEEVVDSPDPTPCPGCGSKRGVHRR